MRRQVAKIFWVQVRDGRGMSPVVSSSSIHCATRSCRDGMVTKRHRIWWISSTNSTAGFGRHSCRHKLQSTIIWHKLQSTIIWRNIVSSVTELHMFGIALTVQLWAMHLAKGLGRGCKGLAGEQSRWSSAKITHGRGRQKFEKHITRPKRKLALVWWMPNIMNGKRGWGFINRSHSHSCTFQGGQSSRWKNFFGMNHCFPLSFESSQVLQLLVCFQPHCNSWSLVKRSMFARLLLGKNKRVLGRHLQLVSKLSWNGPSTIAEIQNWNRAVTWGNTFHGCAASTSQDEAFSVGVNDATDQLNVGDWK